MESTTRPEKRKIEDSDEEEVSSKRSHLITEEPSIKEELPVSEQTTDSVQVKVEPQEAEDDYEAYEPLTFEEETLLEAAATTTQIEPPAPVDTVVPFDRLVVLHLEATCDENPTNPAAVQVTKENSEIIGKKQIRYLSLQFLKNAN